MLYIIYSQRQTDGVVHGMTDFHTVNLGDLMMRWTNDRWRSTLHRVVNPPAATNDLSRRLSIGMFFIPNYDAVVAPIAGPGEASKYMPITVAEYRTSRFASTASEAAAE